MKAIVILFGIAMAKNPVFKHWEHDEDKLELPSK
jgi:hypothetical protein